MRIPARLSCNQTPFRWVFQLRSNSELRHVAARAWKNAGWLGEFSCHNQLQADNTKVSNSCWLGYSAIPLLPAWIDAGNMHQVPISKFLMAINRAKATAGDSRQQSASWYLGPARVLPASSAFNCLAIKLFWNTQNINEYHQNFNLLSSCSHSEWSNSHIPSIPGWLGRAHVSPLPPHHPFEHSALPARLRSTRLAVANPPEQHDHYTYHLTPLVTESTRLVKYVCR